MTYNQSVKASFEDAKNFMISQIIANIFLGYFNYFIVLFRF